MNKLVVVMFSLVFIVFGISFVVSQPVLSEPSLCCEKTTSGLWCVNEDASECDPNYRSAPASCQSTSYCKLGTCYDSSEGICMENTPQRVCEEGGGTWDERDLEEVPQCQLGCCLIADQASYVPLVRCKKLSTFFGVTVDYRTDVDSEISCIVLANSQDVGACVYEKEFERTCEFTTRGSCGAEETVEPVTNDDQTSSSRKFYKDYLCSAEELNTVCARQATVGCYQGKAYYFDSCGNRENVYSSNEDASWNNGRVAEPDEICSPNDGSTTSCGNCDYLLGSRCEATEGLLDGERAYCQRTDCTDRWGNSRKNGESWCTNDGFSGSGSDKVGSRYYREVCVDGEVRVEPCADFRNEVCYESVLDTSAGDYSVAACRINRWQECIGIVDEDTCLNTDKRDCTWLPSPTGLLIGGLGTSQGISSGITGFTNPTTSNTGVQSSGENLGSPTFTNPTDSGFTGNSILGFGDDDDRAENETTESNREDGVCVPEFPPGLLFWEGGSSESVCNLVGARCVVKYEKKLFGEWDCVENCECLDSSWATSVNQICVAQGDCGAYVNYVGQFTDGGYEWKTADGKLAFKAGDENYISSGFTGRVITDVESENANTLNREIFK